jgi:hypothetical protein
MRLRVDRRGTGFVFILKHIFLVSGANFFNMTLSQGINIDTPRVKVHPFVRHRGEHNSLFRRTEIEEEPV